MERLKRRQFTAEFKLEAARYVLDQGMSFAEVGKRLGVVAEAGARLGGEVRGGRAGGGGAEAACEAGANGAL